MPSSSEQALISRARQGSATAFGELVVLYQDRLYRFLLCRSATRADAEDAMQEAFINAFRYIDSYDARWQFSTWLYRIALRELGKARDGRERARLADGAEVSTGRDPLSECMAEDQRRNLWLTARAVLGEQAFTTLWLRYAEDLPVRDVARVMGRPATWVKVVAHRARRRLARAVAEYEDGGHAVATDPATDTSAATARTRARLAEAAPPVVVKETAR